MRPDWPDGHTSTEAHGSLGRAFDVAGLGARVAGVPPMSLRCDVLALRAAIAADRSAEAAVHGHRDRRQREFSAVDDLNALGLREEKLAPIDGAWVRCVAGTGLRHLVAASRADSLAFDLPGLHVPYDAARCCATAPARQTPADHAPYLARDARHGRRRAVVHRLTRTRVGSCALSVWFTMKTTAWPGELIARRVRWRGVGRTDRATRRSSVAAPVTLNVACFRYVPARRCD